MDNNKPKKRYFIEFEEDTLDFGFPYSKDLEQALLNLNRRLEILNRTIKDYEYIKSIERELLNDPDFLKALEDIIIDDNNLIIALIENDRFINGVVGKVSEVIVNDPNFLTKIVAKLEANEEFINALILGVKNELETDPDFINALLKALVKLPEFITTIVDGLKDSEEFINAIGVILSENDTFITNVGVKLTNSPNFISILANNLSTNPELLNALKTSLKGDDEFLTDIGNKIAEAGKFINKLVEKLKSDPTMIEALKTALKEDTEFLNDLATLLGGNSTLITSLVDALKTNADLLSALKTSLTTDEAFLQGVADKLAENQKLIDDIVAKLQTSDELLTALITKLEADEGFLKSLATQLSANQDLINALITNLGSNETLITKIGDNLTTNTTFVNNLATKLQDNQTLISALATSLGTNETLIQTITTAIQGNQTFISQVANDVAPNLINNTTFIQNVADKLSESVITKEYVDTQDQAILTEAKNWTNSMWKPNASITGRIDYQGADYVFMNGKRITSVGNPTAPTDATNKTYVDNSATSSITTAGNNAKAITGDLANLNTSAKTNLVASINEVNTNKQNKLTAGANITISPENVISATSGEQLWTIASGQIKPTTTTLNISANNNFIQNVKSGTAETDAVNVNQLNAKQNILVAGDNINIDGNTISATFSDLWENISSSMIRPKNSASVSMGSQKITGLASGTTSTDAVNKSQLDTKQNILVAGSGISITGDTISATSTGDSLWEESGSTVSIKSATASRVDLGNKYLLGVNDPVSDNYGANKKYVDTLGKTKANVSDLNNKQDKLIAGSGITIVGSTISATGGDSFFTQGQSNTIELKEPNHYIYVLTAPVSGGDLANKKYVDDKVAGSGENLWEQDGTWMNMKTATTLYMTSKRIQGLANGTTSTDAVNKSQLDLKADLTAIANINDELNTKQNKTDSSLTTTSKDVVGAINEINAKPSGNMIFVNSEVSHNKTGAGTIVIDSNKSGLYTLSADIGTGTGNRILSIEYLLFDFATSTVCTVMINAGGQDLTFRGTMGTTTEINLLGAFEIQNVISVKLVAEKLATQQEVVNYINKQRNK